MFDDMLIARTSELQIYLYIKIEDDHKMIFLQI